MSNCEKAARINAVSTPFGFCYICGADIFTSSLDAWQRGFGYHMLYDRLAWRFNMIFDYEPVYFYYDDKTWLIEFWKGQYGANTGAEIGIYYTEGIVAKESLASTLFTCADDRHMLPLSLDLKRFGKSLVSISQRHWWLSVFDTGLFSQPSSLTVQAGITFPNYGMLRAFLEGMQSAGYRPEEVRRRGLNVTFSFDKMRSVHADDSVYPFYKKFRTRLVQFGNALTCRLFVWITKPFTTTLDRLLFLELLTPRLLRRCFRIRSYEKRGKVCRKVRRSTISS